MMKLPNRFGYALAAAIIVFTLGVILVALIGGL